MRTFEERMAEISRRSDEIFKKRKKMRNRLLTAAASLVLCVGLWGTNRVLYEAFNCTEVPDRSESQSVADCETSNENAQVKEYTSTVEVTGTEICNLVVDEAEVKRISDFLDGLTIPQDTVDSQTPHEYAMGATVETDRPLTPQRYRIVVTYEDGSRAEYTLAGSALTNEENGERMVMTDDTLTELKKLLGISE